MTEFRITKPGEYRLRNGKKAIVLCTDAPSKWSVVGYYIDANGVNAWAWLPKGYVRYGESIGKDPFDIISEWKEPEVLEFWYGLYDNNEFSRRKCKDLDEVKGYNPNALGYIKTRLTINPDGTKDIEIIEKVWG